MVDVAGSKDFTGSGDVYDRFMGRYSQLLAPAFADFCGATAHVEQPLPGLHSTPDAAAGGDHTVESGDTLASIAEAHGVAGGWRAILDANRGEVSDPDLVYVGQTLQLP